MKKTLLYRYIILTLLVSISSCTTPYNYVTNEFEDVIVIEATITNQLKKQEIKLSRSYKFEENGPVFETGATISITDDLGNTYGFNEGDNSYLSATEFQVLPGRNYQLHVKTSNGKSYSSSNEKLTTETKIEDVLTSVKTKDGILGVEIRTKSFDPTNKSLYYRYEYDETYKIVAPRWVDREAIAKTTPYPGEITLVKRTTEAKTCYSTKSSDRIITTSSSKLSEDRIDFPIRFIASTDYIIANRYTINVKQYIQNLAAYTYYETLKNLSGDKSLLSQNQPGFFGGNIKSDTDINEKVIGFFDVSAFSEKRIFFNFSDIFPNEHSPEYPYNCPIIDNENIQEHSFPYCKPSPPDNYCQAVFLTNSLNAKTTVFFGGYPFLGEIPLTGGFILEVYPIECGDCTSFSSNIKPSFWID